MFKTDASSMSDCEWTITVQHGERKLTMHSIAELMNFLLFPCFVERRECCSKFGMRHSPADTAFTLMRAIRAHSNASLRELRDFIMGEHPLPEPGETRDPARARLDADGTAKPLTRIIHHPPVGVCVGPGTTLIQPEYEDAAGKRTPIR